VQLLGDVRAVFRELHTNNSFRNVKVGISSRTDEPAWARELLTKFPIPLSDEGMEGTCIHVETVFNGPIEISQDEKVDHFHRIAKKCNIDFEDILFFDNEYRICESVANLGVSVVYCLDGVTKELWDLGVYEEFPRSNGSSVVNVDFVR
jgi:magnesium-dependent phosphatase 1